MNQVVLTTNSPGELHSWVRGTVAELKRRRPDLRVVVALVPCPYASGAEARVAARIPGVDQVLRPLQTVRLAMGIPDRSSRLQGRGVVVFMGGEPWHALLLARALRWPAVAYAVRAGALARCFARVGTLDPGIEQALRRQGVTRVRTVGNLVLDGVEIPPELPSGPHRPTLGLFPGSRGLHLRAALAVFLRTAELVRLEIPELECLLAVSPFVRREDVLRALERPLRLGIPTARGSLEGDRLRTEDGLEVEVLWGSPYEAMARMDVGLTIPGTNTGEMACVGRPMVVGLSASAPIPRGGLCPSCPSSSASCAGRPIAVWCTWPSPTAWPVGPWFPRWWSSGISRSWSGPWWNCSEIPEGGAGSAWNCRKSWGGDEVRVRAWPS